MIVVGGHPLGNAQTVVGGASCLTAPGMAMIFNLNDCTVQPDWDPSRRKDYQVPELVRATIGGRSVLPAMQRALLGLWSCSVFPAGSLTTGNIVVMEVLQS